MTYVSKTIIFSLIRCTLITLKRKSQDRGFVALIAPRHAIVIENLDLENSLSFKRKNLTSIRDSFKLNENTTSVYNLMVKNQPQKPLIYSTHSNYYQCQEANFRTHTIGIGVEILGQLLLGTKGF
mgnify:CR=1 FL=1